jgi:hypothetical protein
MFENASLIVVSGALRAILVKPAFAKTSLVRLHSMCAKVQIPISNKVSQTAPQSQGCELLEIVNLLASNHFGSSIIDA